LGPHGPHEGDPLLALLLRAEVRRDHEEIIVAQRSKYAVRLVNTLDGQALALEACGQRAGGGLVRVRARERDDHAGRHRHNEATIIVVPPRACVTKCFVSSAILFGESLILLEIATGQAAGRSFELDRAQHPQVTIGRADSNAVVVPDYHLSGEHGQLFYEDDQVIYRDLRSTNGSAVQPRD